MLSDSYALYYPFHFIPTFFAQNARSNKTRVSKPAYLSLLPASGYFNRSCLKFPMLYWEKRCHSGSSGRIFPWGKDPHIWRQRGMTRYIDKHCLLKLFLTEGSHFSCFCVRIPYCLWWYMSLLCDILYYVMYCELLKTSNKQLSLYNKK